MDIELPPRPPEFHPAGPCYSPLLDPRNLAPTMADPNRELNDRLREIRDVQSEIRERLDAIETALRGPEDDPCDCIEVPGPIKVLMMEMSDMFLQAMAAGPDEFEAIYLQMAGLLRAFRAFDVAVTATDSTTITFTYMGRVFDRDGNPADTPEEGLGSAASTT